MVQSIPSLYYISSGCDAFEIVCPGDISSTSSRPSTGHHQLAHLRGLGAVIVALVADDDVVSLLAPDLVSRLAAEGRVVHLEDERCGVGEDVPEGDGGGGAGLDGVRSLGLGGDASAEEGEGVLPAKR